MVASLADVAENQLGLPLAKHLRLRLYTVFTKTGDDACKFFNWQNEVFYKVGGGPKADRKHVKPCYESSVYNALVLFYLLSDAAQVRSVITQLAGFDKSHGSHAGSDTFLSELRSRLECQNKARYLEYIVLGVIPERISAVIECLANPEFDILRQQLPSPFEDGSLKPIALHMGLPIDWRDYKQQVDRVEEMWRAGALAEALSMVDGLINQSVIRIPLAEKMRDDIRSKLQEHQQLRSFLSDL